MTSIEVPRLSTRREVAEFLGVPLDKLTWWIWALQPQKRYQEFQIARRDGAKPRLIRAPIKPIKDLQRSLAQMLDRAYRPPVHAHGFVKGRGPVTSATRHEQQKWVLKLDIEDFFPSIHFGRVYGLFGAYPFHYPHEVATTLAQLCCHQNELPQGAPTSPVISNLICRGMDKDLAELARRERCFYSRYADDLCFSTNRNAFPSGLATRDSEGVKLGDEILSILENHGFSPHAQKTQLVFRAQRQRVTGLVVNAKVNISRNYVRSLRNVLYIWDKYGPLKAADAFYRREPPRDRPPGKTTPDFKLIIRGRVQRVGAIQGWDSPTYRRLANRLKRLDDEFAGPHEVEGGVGRLKLLTEGKTDVQHMLAAQRYFHERGEFLDIHLTGADDSGSGGGSKLLRRCKQLAEFPPEQPCLALFDTDEPKVLKEAIDDEGWKIWGDNVVAIAIATPNESDPGEPLCIELLHSEEILKTKDATGRRIYLRSEFDSKAGSNEDGSRVIPAVGNSTLVQETVFSLPDKSQVAMKKEQFARNIVYRRHPFEAVTFEGFRNTFKAVEEASRALAQARAFAEDQRQ